MQAHGTFAIDSFEPSDAEDWDGSQFGTVELRKTFSGEVEGTSIVRMMGVTAPVATSRAYAAFEHVTATVAGRGGSFVLQHGALSRGPEDETTLALTIVTDTGTGELAGISGTARIDRDEDGTHRFTLDYELPDGD